MSLYLLEFPAAGERRADLDPLFADVTRAASAAGGEVIEIQVGVELKRVYVIAEHGDRAVLTAALNNAGVPAADVAEVRLVGATLDQVKAAKGGAEFLVEWDLPKELTMETYLARKKAKAPLYANVPEVKFLRTYVREDMMKCLCFYQAPDEDAVRRAREAVSTPIDRLTRLAETADAPR